MTEDATGTTALDSDDLLRREDVATRLRVGLRTVERIFASGELELINVGTATRPQWRVSELALARYIQKRSRSAV